MGAMGFGVVFLPLDLALGSSVGIHGMKDVGSALLALERLLAFGTGICSVSSGFFFASALALHCGTTDFSLVLLALVCLFVSVEELLQRPLALSEPLQVPCIVE